MRTIVECGAVVFSHMPQYLSSALERIQERAMSIIFPGGRYEVALARAGLATQEARWADACML